MDPFDAIGGTFGGLFNMASQERNNKFIAQENKNNRAFSHNEAILAHERQLQIMNKQNKWNSYKNQRKLLEDAGYNPNALFNSASTLSASSGASGGAQASTPSSGYPTAPQFDPSAIIAFADAKLKAAQAKNVDADTRKKDSEALGQDLQNSYQSISNAIFKKYGEREKILDLNQKDSEVALNDAQRLLIRTQDALNVDELYNMRPKEAAKVIAETNSANASVLLSRAQAAKTDQERDLLIRQYLLSLAVSNATVAHLYALKRNLDAQTDYTETQANLWKPGEILYKGAQADTMFKVDNANSNRKLYYSLFEDYKESVKTQLKATGLYNSRIAAKLDGWTGFALSYFSDLGNIIPGANPYISVPQMNTPSTPW